MPLRTAKSSYYSRWRRSGFFGAVSGLGGGRLGAQARDRAFGRPRDTTRRHLSASGAGQRVAAGRRLLLYSAPILRHFPCPAEPPVRVRSRAAPPRARRRPQLGTLRIGDMVQPSDGVTRSPPTPVRV
eukprot:COSAG06_NODE_1001_length_11135_cov_3.577111_3_plen_128_part_00